MKEGFVFYLVKRGILAFFTLFIILFTSYFLMRLAPGDPSRSTMLGEGKSELASDRSQVGGNDVLKQKLHLDKPVTTGFYYWLKNVCKGDFGDSVAVDKGRPVISLIMEHLPNTLKLNILALLLTYALAIPLGIFSAVKGESKLDTSISIFLVFLFSLPVLWSALMLQALFCKGGLYPVFPLKGLAEGFHPGMSSWQIAGKTLMHYVLPVICLSYGSFAALARFTRGGMLEVIR
ncbi:MAG: ABC transporter permease, partial [Lentisphaeria bacterium]|nr:ABC transporter permease [Lentisphaeria bacterium]